MDSRTIANAAADIFDGAVERRQAVGRAWLARAQSDRKRLDVAIAGVERAYRETREAWTGRVCGPDEQPMIDIELQAKADRMRGGAIAATILEVIFGAVVAAFSLDFGRFLAGVVGGIVAVLLILVIEGMHVQLYNPNRPIASRTRIEHWTIVWSVVFIAGLLPLLVSRTVPETAPIANVAFPVTTVGLTTTAALLAIAAHVFSWTRRFTRIHNGLLFERAATEQFIHELESFLRQREARITTFAR